MSFVPSRARRQRRIVICRCLAGFITAAVLGSLFLPSSAIPVHSPINVLSESRTFERLWNRAPNRDQVPVGLTEEFDGNQSSSNAATNHEETPLHIRIMQLGDRIDDEIHAQALLAKFEQSGEAHLRDLATRVPLFKDLFTEWESLHHFGHEGQTGALDIVPRLRSMGLPPLDLGDAITTYDRIRTVMNRLGTHLFPWTMAYYADHMDLHASLYHGGRGIVMTAGNQQAPYLYTAIPALRDLGCTLPIEILYLGDADLYETGRDRLSSLPGVVLRDLSQMINDQSWGLRGWAGKPFAILMSSFREAIFIDADSLFMQNPEVLFDDPQYAETGALFFKDRNVMTGSKKDWITSILPHPHSRQIKMNRMWTGESMHMQESGVIVVDKWRHFVALLLTTRLNGPDRDVDPTGQRKGIYTMVFGDKETFWLSWEMAGDTDYAFHGGLAGNMGQVQVDRSKDVEQVSERAELTGAEMSSAEFGDQLDALAQGSPVTPGGLELQRELKICSPQLLHLDLDGRPLWFNGWVSTNKFRATADLEYISFQGYLKESPEAGGPKKEDWKIQGSNVVCLKSTFLYEFTAKEAKHLESLIASAKSHRG